MIGALFLSLAALASTPATPCYSPDGSLSPRGPTLSGDVDGDGLADRIWTEAEWVDPQSCRATLVVETHRGVLRAPVTPEGPVAAPPGLAGLIDLDRRSGLEVTVVTQLGASTTFVSVFTVRGRRLAALGGPLLGHGGSVVNRSGVDCASKRGTLLVSSEATLGTGGRRYRVVRRFFALQNTTLTLRPKLTESYRLREPGLARFSEFAEQIQPFPSCTQVT